MNGKEKKAKNELKSNDDLIEIKTDKKVSFNHHDNDDDNSRTYSVDFENKPGNSRKRKNTKISHKTKGNNIMNFKLDNDSISEKGKKVRFNKIDVIDVESWKKINLQLTAEENLDELLKITKGKKGKDKNVSCNCIIL